jgi:serine/threonine protein kinase
VREYYLDEIRNTVYTVMDYIEGEQLQERVLSKGPLKEQQAKKVL